MTIKKQTLIQRGSEINYRRSSVDSDKDPVFGKYVHDKDLFIDTGWIIEDKIIKSLHLGSDSLQLTLDHYTLFVPPDEVHSGSEYFWVKKSDTEIRYDHISSSKSKALQ